MTDTSIELDSVGLVEHVREAFYTAGALASGVRQVEARDLLRAALIVPPPKSESFSRLRDLLPLEDPRSPAGVIPRKTLIVSGPLARSFELARTRCADSSMWGRDYVTLALLAVGDPSLEEIAAEAGTSLDDLQDQWFQYVSMDDAHRNPSEWEEWWRAAGVPLPNERKKLDKYEYGELVQRVIDRAIQIAISIGPLNDVITTRTLLEALYDVGAQQDSEYSSSWFLHNELKRFAPTENRDAPNQTAKGYHSDA